MEYAEFGKKNPTKIHEDFSVTGIMSMRWQAMLPWQLAGRLECANFKSAGIFLHNSVLFDNQEQTTCSAW